MNSASAAIAFDEVRKSFKVGVKQSTVLNDLSIAVQTGEILGFLGPNGAGKSTSIKLLLGFIKPDSGTIMVEDRVVGKDSIQDRIGYLPEVPCFYENLTGKELLFFAGRTHGLARSEIDQRCHDILNRMSLAHAGSQRVKTYSKGMRQRLGLSLALLHDPDIVILDEPMSGLDPMGRHLVAEVIMELKSQGKTVFFSSHILSDIERMCDRIGILNRGRLLYCGDVSAFMEGDRNLEESFIRLIAQDEGP